MINEYQLRSFLESILTVGDTERYMNALSINDVQHIVNTFKKKEPSFKDKGHKINWLKTVFNKRLEFVGDLSKDKEASPKNKVRELSDLSPEDFEHMKRANEMAWNYALKSPLAKKALEVFESLTREEKLLYQGYGRTHMSYGYEQNMFAWNPLVEIGSEEFEAEMDRYDQHMDRVEKGCIIAVVISHYRQGILGMPKNIVEEKSKKLREVDALTKKIKSLNFKCVDNI